MTISLSISFKSKNEFATLGSWGTDHYSHYMSGILFFYKGFDIYKKPVSQNCTPDNPKQWRSKHDCNIIERSGKRPLKINWNIYPRLYPPGNQAYALTESLLYEYTSLSFHTINKISVIKYVLVAHFLFLLLYIFLAKTELRHWNILRWTVMPLLFSQILYHSFAGFYDPLSVLFVFLSAVLIQQRKDLDALLLFSVGVFIHYRSLWFLPVPLLALWRISIQQGYPRWTRKNIAKIIGSFILLTGAAYPFLLLYGFFGLTPPNSAVYWKNASLANTGWINYLIFVSLTFVVLLRRRPRLLTVVFMWQVVMFINTPVTQTWYALHLLPYFGFLYQRAGRADLPIFALISAIYLAQSLLVFNDLPLPGLLLSQFINGQY